MNAIEIVLPQATMWCKCATCNTCIIKFESAKHRSKISISDGGENGEKITLKAYMTN